MYRQPSLFGIGERAIDATFAGIARRWLDATSWVDFCPGWLRGSDQVFDDLVDGLPWEHRRVKMYDRLLDEPRLTSWWQAGDGDGDDEPLPVLRDARRSLSDRYGRAFDSIGFNFYRTGSDSVAWHGDRHRHHVANPLVAIVSVGDPRTFRLRPAGGGRSISYEMRGGDLLVMGGACQHDWEHSIPKLSGRVGPRISVTFRHGSQGLAASNVAERWLEEPDVP